MAMEKKPCEWRFTGKSLIDNRYSAFSCIFHCHVWLPKGNRIYNWRGLGRCPVSSGVSPDAWRWSLKSKNGQLPTADFQHVEKAQRYARVCVYIYIYVYNCIYTYTHVWYMVYLHTITQIWGIMYACIDIIDNIPLRPCDLSIALEPGKSWRLLN